MTTSKIAREPMTPDQIAALNFHPGWDDGRVGYVWCRFDAMLTPADDPRHLRAEVTWDDDGDFVGNDGVPRCYFDPELWIEANAKRADGTLTTVAGRRIAITRTEAATLLHDDPREILIRYAAAVADLPKSTDMDKR
jgi:hypothetical protein